MQNSKKLIVGLIIAVVVIVGAAVSFIMMNQGNSGQTQDVEIKNTETEFWTLLVGNDTRTGTADEKVAEYADGSARSDTIMLVHVNTVDKKVAIITVPRDTRCDVDGQPNKLNEVYKLGGIEGLNDEVEKLTGVRAKYYLDTNFVGFEKLVDSLEGVNANVPINMQLKDIVSGKDVNLEAGEQQLDGAQALVLARSRKQYKDDLDACRQIQDRQLVEKMIIKVADNPELSKLASGFLLDNCKTNMTSEVLTQIIDAFANSSNSIQFISGTGPYKGGVDNSAGGLWLAKRDEETWKKVIATALDGGDLNEVVKLPQVASK